MDILCERVCKVSAVEAHTPHSSEEASWCESVHHPLEEQRVERGREHGVGPGAGCEGDRVSDVGRAVQASRRRLLLSVRLLVSVEARMAA